MPIFKCRIIFLTVFGALLLTAVMGLTYSARAEEPIRLVFAEGSAPLAFETDGQIRGIEVDVAREIFTTRLGLSITTALYPWERAQQMVRSGAADGFISIATDERQLYAQCGRTPVVHATMRPVVRRNFQRREEIEAARSLADLKKFSMVSYLGNGWAKNKLAGFKVFNAADFPASLRGLARGRGDVAVVADITGFYYLRELQLNDDLMMLPFTADTVDYVLCLGKTSPHAPKLAEFERVLDVLHTDGGYARILAQYGLPEAP